MKAFPQTLTWSSASAALLAFLCMTPMSYAGEVAASPPHVNRGFLQMYSLDFDGAHATFVAYQREHPDDPMGYVSNAAAYLFSEFNRLHVLESDLFTDDRKFDNRGKLTPDPAVKREFGNELNKGTELPTSSWRRIHRTREHCCRW